MLFNSPEFLGFLPMVSGLLEVNSEPLMASSPSSNPFATKRQP